MGQCFVERTGRQRFLLHRREGVRSVGDSEFRHRRVFSSRQVGHPHESEQRRPLIPTAGRDVHLDLGGGELQLRLLWLGHAQSRQLVPMSRPILLPCRNRKPRRYVEPTAHWTCRTEERAGGYAAERAERDPVTPEQDHSCCGRRDDRSADRGQLVDRRLCQLAVVRRGRIPRRLHHRAVDASHPVPDLRRADGRHHRRQPGHRLPVPPAVPADVARAAEPRALPADRSSRASGWS